MSGTGATGKVKSERSKSIWDVDYGKMEERKKKNRCSQKVDQANEDSEDDGI